MTTETPQIPLERVTDERLPLAETAQPPNRVPTIWLLIALAFVVWAVCVMGGCR